MTRTRAGTLLLVCIVAMTLTGCTPGVIGAAGLQRVGDRFQVVVVTCEGSTLDVLTLRDRSSVNDSNEYSTVAEWQAPDASEGIATADIGSASEFLKELGAGREFMLHGTEAGLEI